MSKYFFLSFVLLSLLQCAHAQIDKQSDLFIELQKMDNLLFEKGFNQCDFKTLEEISSDDLRFYHDQIGVVDKAGFLSSIQNNICSNLSQKPIRKLEVGSLEVFPLYNNGELYGGIQNGIHHFYIRERNKPDRLTSSARFTTVWIKEDNQWKMGEVLSFDHQDPVAEANLKEEIEQLLAEQKVPALGLGIIENGKLVSAEVYGSLDKVKPAPKNTIFKVASLTKPVFAITVLNLIDQGRLGLDEPLFPYWVDPAIKGDERHKLITPRMVLTHRTGFPNWRYLEEDNQLRFQFEPGTKYQYSGEGFEYLRKAIERKEGKSIEEIAEALVFKPAGMTDTRFWWDKGMDESRYAQNFDEKGEKIPTSKYYEANAAANLLSTVEDYGKFLVYVNQGAGLSKELFQEMCSFQVDIRPENHFGLGWEIFSNFPNDELVLVHSGKDPGVSTLAVIFPKSKNGFLIFMNGDNIIKIYEKLLKERLYLGAELWDRQ